MSGFTDIHAHFVYGLDDGAQTLEDMKAMLDAACADGIAALFATPHVIPGVRPFDDALFERHLQAARDYCEEKAYAITLHKGAEIMYTPVLQQYVLERSLPVMAGTNRILLEFIPQISYGELEAAVDLLERSGYVTILAHVERYRCLAAGRNAYILKQAHDVRYQMNGSSILEGGFFQTRKVWRWLQDGLIDHIATDAHSCHRRPSNMTRAYKLLCRRVGETYADQLTGRSS